MCETIHKMVDMLEITSTPDLLAEMIMKCPDLRCAVKYIILEDLDDQCQKLWSCSQENSSAKHKVEYVMDCFQECQKDY